MRVDVHGYQTRGNHNSDVYPPTVKRSIYRNSLLYSGAILWNNLPSHIKDCTNVDSFKEEYRNYFNPNLESVDMNDPI